MGPYALVSLQDCHKGEDWNVISSHARIEGGTGIVIFHGGHSMKSI